MSPSRNTIRNPVRRPLLAYWMFDRRYTIDDGALLFGRSREQVRRWLLPFGDPKRKLPTAEEFEVIAKVTEGDVRREHFEDPANDIADAPAPVSA